MEEHIMNSEHNMMLERKRLNLMFQTVVDGIIIIDTIGTILRFNISSERMFGYSAQEIIGKNIKVLQTEEIASQHDMFLKNYLETGIKKVIGSGRAADAKKKDGSFFPVHLSLSEVKSEGVHIFTGVLRDLTEEVKALELAKTERAQKEIEIST
ncbi:hypothetical protein HMI55_003404 [Coelomomyces lativittatus]|nr:hypothetical protein HMI55_003404 [Coelomomyces lativittatus]